jgi:hypothetical protein
METSEDPLSRLLKFLGNSWSVVSSSKGLRLCRGDQAYVSGSSRKRLFRKFATQRPMFGPVGEGYFRIPKSLDSSSEEELLLKLSVAEKNASSF